MEESIKETNEIKAAAAPKKTAAKKTTRKTATKKKKHWPLKQMNYGTEWNSTGTGTVGKMYYTGIGLLTMAGK